MGADTTVEVAFGALVEVFLQLFYRASLFALFALVPQAIRSLLLVLGGGDNPVFKSFEPTHII